MSVTRSAPTDAGRQSRIAVHLHEVQIRELRAQGVQVAQVCRRFEHPRFCELAALAFLPLQELQHPVQIGLGRGEVLVVDPGPVHRQMCAGLRNVRQERVGEEHDLLFGSDAHKSATLRLDDMHLRTHKWTALGAYARSKLAVMLWGLELDRRLRAAHSPVVTHLTHPGFVASNLSHVSDRPLLAVAHRTIKAQPAWSRTTSTPGQRRRSTASPSPSRPAAMSASTARSAFTEDPS